jgi:hypothetical protein
MDLKLATVALGELGERVSVSGPGPGYELSGRAV